jgi:hypothetical protein
MPPPVPTSVEPAAAKEGERQRLRILGERFYVGGVRQLGEGVRINALYSARIGGVELEEVERLGEGELVAYVPGSVSVGTWNVEVTGPAGTGLLASGFTVLPRELCSDNADNDGDGLKNCEDPECLAQTCDDGNGCTLNDVCTAQGTCVGGPCVPPSPCWRGGCDAGVCDLRIAVGASCTDGLSCTVSDTCQGDGGCAGNNNCTTPPTACHQPTGTCEANSTCSYAVAEGSPCNDGAACTAADTCTASATCVGSSYSCAPAGECFASACDGTGGCLVSPTFGAPCGDAGVCLGDGGCLPVVWPYQPSNFQPSGGPPGPTVTIPSGCTVWFNSTNNAWQNQSQQCAGVVLPSGTVVTMPGATEAVLFSVWNLTLQPNALIILFGDRPVIFGAFGDIRIQGDVRVNTSVTNVNGNTGAGANPASCGQMTGGNATTSTAGGGGGAFGGAGASGAGAGAGAGGIPGSPSTEPLRGGCRGGNGGGVSGGLGGSGGGAVQFSAGGLLEVSSVITASGSGAKGATGSGSAGGGGGGSGGMILLEGDKVNITSTAILTSNGGGGGSGEGQSAGKSGEDGSLTTAAPAPGGTGSPTAGQGGSGGTGTAAPTPGQPGTTGGSGGGGAAVGVIFVRANQNAPGSCVHQPAVASPPPVYINCP